jgi:hypothetical protein
MWTAEQRARHQVENMLNASAYITTPMKMRMFAGKREIKDASTWLNAMSNRQSLESIGDLYDVAVDIVGVCGRRVLGLRGRAGCDREKYGNKQAEQFVRLIADNHYCKPPLTCCR